LTGDRTVELDPSKVRIFEGKNVVRDLFHFVRDDVLEQERARSAELDELSDESEEEEDDYASLARGDQSGEEDESEADARPKKRRKMQSKKKKTSAANAASPAGPASNDAPAGATSHDLDSCSDEDADMQANTDTRRPWYYFPEEHPLHETHALQKTKHERVATVKFRRCQTVANLKLPRKRKPCFKIVLTMHKQP
jgi:hypothetical protein